MILTDLPFGTTKNSWDIVIPFEPLWEQYNRVCKLNSAVVLFSQMPFTIDLASSNRKNFRYEIIWEKNLGTGHLNANRMPMKIHENILVFYRKLPTYNPQKSTGHKNYSIIHDTHSENYGKQRIVQNICTDGTRFPTDVIRFSSCNTILKKPLHPIQKPVELLEYLIRTYTNEGDMVLDSCMGVGSTGVACRNTGRDFIGIEKDEHYFQIAKQRIDGNGSVQPDKNVRNRDEQISFFLGE